jgi:hypothetical protein
MSQKSSIPAAKAPAERVWNRIPDVQPAALICKRLD